MSGLIGVSRDTVITHNLRLHEETAEQYDEIHYYLRNRFEQTCLWRDLSLVHKWLQGRVTSPVRYLDLGCGTGNITLKLLTLGAEVIGVDLSPAMVRVLNQKVVRAGYEGRFAGFVGSADDLASIEGVQPLLAKCHALCMSSVLHHLYDYLAPFKHLEQLCPSLQVVFITHEPCGRATLNFPGRIQRVYNHGVRQLDLWLSKRIKRPAERCPDDPIADYHAFKNGIHELEIAKVLSEHGFNKRLIYRRYNMRRTTLASVIDNVLLRALRNDIFPITMFTLAMAREPLRGLEAHNPRSGLFRE